MFNYIEYKGLLCEETEQFDRQRTYTPSTHPLPFDYHHKPFCGTFGRFFFSFRNDGSKV